MISQEVHGHEVLRLVGNAATPFTRESLEARVRQLWGAEARFHTCSMQGLRIEELLDFLSNRGKIVAAADGSLSVDFGEVCTGD